MKTCFQTFERIVAAALLAGMGWQQASAGEKGMTSRFNSQVLSSKVQSAGQFQSRPQQNLAQANKLADQIRNYRGRPGTPGGDLIQRTNISGKPSGANVKTLGPQNFGDLGIKTRPGGKFSDVIVNKNDKVTKPAGGSVKPYPGKFGDAIVNKGGKGGKPWEGSVKPYPGKFGDAIINKGGKGGKPWDGPFKPFPGNIGDMIGDVGGGKGDKVDPPAGGGAGQPAPADPAPTNPNPGKPGGGNGQGGGKGNGKGKGKHHHHFPWEAIVVNSLPWNRPYYPEPVYYPAPQVVVQEVPVYVEQPAATDPAAELPAAQPAAGTSSVDLVLEDVQFVEPATLVAGPAYRVVFRNQGLQPIGKFRVALFATDGGKPTDESPRAIVEVGSLAADQSSEVTMRLPRTAVQQTATGTALTHLLVAVDVDGAVAESDKANNAAVVERAGVEAAR